MPLAWNKHLRHKALELSENIYNVPSPQTISTKQEETIFDEQKNVSGKRFIG